MATQQKKPDQKPDPAVTTATTAALRGDPVAAEEPAVARPFFMSEGVRGDLEIFGKAVDPATGNLLEYDRDTGEVTVTDRATDKVAVVDPATGEVTEL